MRQTGSRLYVGTSGYIYPHWRARFYPAGVPSGRWFHHYATHFSTVELNSPFYRLPGPDTVVRWRRSAPPGFVFAVKASRFLTHMKRLRDPAGPLTLLLRRARRLGETLGPVLFQLPPDFQLDVGRLDTFLAGLARQRLVPGLRAVLEVRHASWLAPEATVRLERAGVALCLADWRELPVTGPITADFVYIRRHGWGVAYGGRYPARALRADAERINAWRQQGLDIYVYFNNDTDAAAIADARRLRALAGQSHPPQWSPAWPMQPGAWTPNRRARIMTKDPVCGMQINEQTAAASAEHQGRTYQFCSEECKEQFEQNPEGYARQTA